MPPTLHLLRLLCRFWLASLLASVVVAATSYTQDRSAATAQPITVTGTLHAVWGDPEAGLPRGRVFLTDDTGRTFELRLDASRLRALGGMAGLTGRRVAVDGELEPAPPGAPAGHAVLRVHAIQLEAGLRPGAPGEPGPAAPVLGSQPWVNLLCRFSDIPATPHPLNYFEELFTGVKPGMDHYWREVSYDQINVLGSRSFGWYDLPHPRSYYVKDVDGDGDVEAALGDLARDCADVADPDVFFPDYIGINLMFNELLDCCAWGGSFTLNIDGQSVRYRMTWEPPRGYNNQEVLAHEMGHGFGLPHSSGPYNNTYDSEWDVMSGKGMCRVPDPVFGCVGIHTISYHKDRLGWFPAERIYAPVVGSVATLALAPLDVAATGAQYSMVKLPISSSSFYTVEARRRVGYDWEIPGPAVVVHEVIEGRDRPARVVDSDGNGDTNDFGARWEPDESFVDLANDLAVTVEPGDEFHDYRVTVRYGVPIPEYAVAVSFTGDGAGVVTSEPDGLACGPGAGTGTCSFDFLLGTTVVLTPQPVLEGPLHSRFDGWGGDCGGGVGESCWFWINGERQVTARFAVLPPAIRVSAQTVTFDAMRGLEDPAPRGVVITNKGGRTLADLTVESIDYGQGASGWLQAALVMEGGVPVRLQVTPTVGGLGAGTHSCTVWLSSETATNSPQSVAVTLSLVDRVSDEAFADALLGGPRLPRTAERILDDLGNGNGSLDLGDFLAWLDASEAPIASATLDRVRGEVP